MLFARLGNKQKLGIGIAVFVFVLISAFFVGYNLKDTGDNSQEPTSQTGMEVKILRTQKEITKSYKEYMERAIERLEKTESREDLISMSENMFFDIYVPTDLRDMHVQKMFEVNKLLENSELNTGELKEKLIFILSELLSENQNIINNL